MRLFLFSLLATVGTAVAQAEPPLCRPVGESSATFTSFGCQINCTINQCAIYFDDNDFTCSKLCRGKPWYEVGAETVYSCAKGATWDVLKGIVLTPAHVWNKIVDSFNENSRFAEFCESNIECKRQLALEAALFDGKGDRLGDDSLKEIYTADLIRKRANVRALAARDPKYQAYLRSKNVPLPQLDAEGAPVDALQAYAKELLKDLGVRWECYNSADRAAMICETLGSLLVPGGAARLAARLGKFGRIRAAPRAPETAQPTIAVEVLPTPPISGTALVPYKAGLPVRAPNKNGFAGAASEELIVWRSYHPTENFMSVPPAKGLSAFDKWDDLLSEQAQFQEIAIYASRESGIPINKVTSFENGSFGVAESVPAERIAVFEAKLNEAARAHVLDPSQALRDRVELIRPGVSPESARAARRSGFGSMDNMLSALADPQMIKAMTSFYNKETSVRSFSHDLISDAGVISMNQSFITARFGKEWEFPSRVSFLKAAQEPMTAVKTPGGAWIVQTREVYRADNVNSGSSYNFMVFDTQTAAQAYIDTHRGIYLSDVSSKVPGATEADFLKALVGPAPPPVKLLEDR